MINQVLGRRLIHGEDQIVHVVAFVSGFRFYNDFICRLIGGNFYEIEKSKKGCYWRNE